MVATSLLFSLCFIEGVRQFGFRVTREEADDYLHLWRYSGVLIGVDPELLPTSEPEARRLADVISATQGPPDADSRRLVDGLVRSPEQFADTEAEARAARGRVAAGYGFCRTLLGDELADELELPDTAWRWAIPLASRIIAPLDRTRARVPAVERLLIRAGERYWNDAIKLGLAGAAARFAPPETLSSRSR